MWVTRQYGFMRLGGGHMTGGVWRWALPARGCALTVSLRVCGRADRADDTRRSEATASVLTRPGGH